MNDIKRKAIRYTLYQMLTIVTIFAVIFLIGKIIYYAPLIYSYIQSLAFYSYIQPWAFYSITALVICYLWYLLNYNRLNRGKITINWILRKSEDKPKCALIHAELLTFDGKTKILWHMNPNDVDFSNDALEPVISYMVVKR
ncbi:hypothetical protein HWA77_16855 [Photobacterium damselae subsp. damselae]|uniref:Uncharacterized protein n=1 Tax=Photobacterium damselae subsp. damselae TaxID=85581 RepID=A0A850QTB4_PHODD|nr:hypothetical protein [Photobacterium damselae subsp. damselae]